MSSTVVNAGSIRYSGEPTESACCGVVIQDSLSPSVVVWSMSSRCRRRTSHASCPSIHHVRLRIRDRWRSLVGSEEHRCGGEYADTDDESEREQGQLGPDVLEGDPEPDHGYR